MTPERHGGLIICGLNYGLPPGGAPKGEADVVPWAADYFTHTSNRIDESGVRDRFVEGLIRWFSWWGIELESDGRPTELDSAITQTNLFCDATRSFAAHPADEIGRAFNRLGELVQELDASGLLLASVGMANAAQLHFGIAQWNASRSGRFSLYQARAAQLWLTVCPHPNSRQSRASVTSVAETMRRWTTSVIEDYRQKQATRPFDRHPLASGAHAASQTVPPSP